jgi:hypothetical protein
VDLLLAPRVIDREHDAAGAAHEPDPPAEPP